MPGSPDAWFDKGGLRAQAAANDLLERQPMALGRDGRPWVYVDGVYRRDPHHLTQLTVDMLGDSWRLHHARTIDEVAGAELARAGRVLPETPTGRLVNVPNGLLDPVTGELEPHTPEVFGTVQLAVGWNPAAACPTFDTWLEGTVGAQADDILEALSLVLRPDIPQRKVVFAFGPSRSGKGTLMRLIGAIVGRDNVTAITLHQLCTNRFAAAGLYGSALNVAGDLSDQHLADLSVFKQLTGDDLVSAEHKFGQAFTFTNTALMVFSANTPPTVNETSSAYLARIRAYAFARTFEGNEDPTIEHAMFDELEGILVRLVEAQRRWHHRGGYAPANPVIADLFARQSDRVRMFVAEVTEPEAGAFVATGDLFARFKTWADQNDRQSMGRNNFLKKADLVLGGRVRERTSNTGARGWRDVKLLHESECDTSDTLATATSAIFTLTFASRERHTYDNGSNDIHPREGGIGRELAEVAVAHNATTTDDEPTAIVEEWF